MTLGDRANAREGALLGAIVAHANHLAEDVNFSMACQVFASEITNGTRDPEHTDRAWYALESFAGGRFVIRATADGLRGEHTIYGSGNPIVESTVGYVE